MIYLSYMQNTLTLSQGSQKSHPIVASTWNPEFHDVSQVQMQMSLLENSSLSILKKYSSTLSEHLQRKDKLSAFYSSNIL